MIHATSNVFLNGVTLAAGTIYSVDPSQATLLTGDLTNKGTVNVGNAAVLYADTNGGTINLTGGGTINLTASNDQIRGYYGNETLVNKDNTIQGQGSISTLASFQNQGTVLANVSGGTLAISNAPTTNCRHVPGQPRQHAPGQRQLHHLGDGEHRRGGRHVG